MNLRIDKEGKSPMYIQLYEQLKEEITDGTYLFGDRLPSKRTVASETGISVIPVEHAYTLLCEEGYAEARLRSGYYVMYKSDDFISTYAHSDIPHAGQIRTHGVSSAVFPFPALAKKMRKVTLDYGDRLLIKSPNRGCPELRSAICAYLRRSNGIAARPEQVIIGSGAEYFYSLLAQFFAEYRLIAAEDPSYEKIAKVYRANGIRTDMLKIGTDGITSSELKRTDARILHVTPFNSYPSGISADANKRREYIKWARERGGYIIEDNYDSELTVSKKIDDTLFASCERVIYLNTFSKTIAPSLRIGYMILPEELLESFEKKLGFYSCTVPVFEQYVIAELISCGDYERHINRVRRKRRLELQSR